MNQAPLATEEDLQLVKEYILLPTLLDVLEIDISTIQSINLNMGGIYEESLRKAQNQIISDVTLLRKKLRERGIKVFEQQHTKLFLEAHYLCRGYQHKFSMLWNLVRAEHQRYLNMHLHIDSRDSL